MTDDSIKTVTNGTVNIYDDDVRRYIGGPDDTNDEHEIYIKIDAPDGAGGSGDLDAFVRIHDISVALTLKRISPPGLQHNLPVVGANKKVNVPINRSTMFTVQADDPEVIDYDPIEYYWKQMVATDSEPSVTDADAFDSHGDAPEKHFNFTDAGNYTIYCMAVYKKKKTEELYYNRDRYTIISEVVSIPVRAWNRPTVHDTPPQDRIDAGDVSWYNGKYVGVKGQTVRLMADGNTMNNDQDEIEKFLWDFDNDWSDVELEQPLSEVASYTWNNPSVSGQVRCKAVTDYGVKSHADDKTGKVFDLTIYDTPQVDPGGDYTGRVNQAITLGGSLTNSYPGASVEYQWRVKAATPEGEVRNNAEHRGDYIQLTEAVDGQNGQIEYVDLPLSDDWSVTGEFWTGGGDGADAFYIYVWANGTPTSEATNKGQYSITFDEWTDEIELYDATNLLKSVSQLIPIDNSEWRPFRVVFYKGEFEVYLDHQLKLEYDDGDYYETRMDNLANNLFGFGARTGEKNNVHKVRNMKWTTGTPVDTTSRGEAEYTWIAEGNYQAGLTARVITLDGLVLEETEFAEARVEAGVPTAMPGGPYRGGIAGGNDSPIQFEGNHPDFVEAEDVGKIQDWTWFPSDDSNGALEFDGQDNKHVIANETNNWPTDAMTVEFWMKSSDESRHGTPISYASSGGDNDIVFFNYQGFSFYITDIRCPATGTTGVSATDGKWHHIAATWQSSDGSLKFYKDGTEVFSDTVATGRAITGEGAFVVGQEQDAIGSGFDRGQAFAGTIDEVLVWNVVRLEEEIRNDMDGELIGNEYGLALYWQFEEGKGDATGDKTNGENDGTLVNMATDADAWSEYGYPVTVHGIWNPEYSYPKAGDYEVGLEVLSESGKWSTRAITDVEVIDGTIAGYVRAADLRTPVRDVRLILTSSHVFKDALARAAANDDQLYTTDTDEGGLWTTTDEKGYYVFEHLPLGNYHIVASKGSGDSAHEFETKVKEPKLTLNGPNQLAIDFVDLSVFPVGGQIVYSIQLNGGDVQVVGVEVTAQPVGSTSGIEALLSTKSLSATNTNYSLPLFAGEYLFLPKKQGHDIRIKEDTPGYDSDTGLVTIEDARTDIDFINHTTRELTVYVEDSGGNPIMSYPDNYSNAGAPITVTVSSHTGTGQVSNATLDSDGEDDAILETTLNPGEYTVTITHGIPEGEDAEGSAEVDLTSGNGTVTMIIPVQIELSFSPRPKLFDVTDEFLEQFGLNPEDNPEGYMYYYSPELRTHTYTITATSNGHPVEDFTLFVIDDVSMLTSDAAVEQELFVEGEEGEYTITGGLPKKTDDAPPLAAPKTVSFRATKDGYDDSDIVEDEVTVLGEVPVGTAAKIVSIPVVNYTVLHDPPGDGSYAYLNDDMSISGIVQGMTHKINDVEVPVYPSPWSTERKIRDVKFEKEPDSDTEFDDLEDKGLLGYKNSDPTGGHFTWVAGLELATGGGIVAMGPIGYVFQVAKLGVKAGSLAGVGSKTGMVQYEISPSRSLKTPSGDTLPDLLGPGKGDVYFGEGWTLGLQTKYRLGIRCTDRDPDDNCLGWELFTEQVETYDILERTNQYIYTPRDIENIIEDLDATINNPETTDEDEKAKLQDALDTWQNLLDRNYAYVWARDYLRKGGDNDGDSLDVFFARGLVALGSYETLIFSAGPTFEYSRAISESHEVSFSTGISISSDSTISNQLEVAFGFKAWGTGTTYEWNHGSSTGIGSSTGFSASWKSGVSTKQKVGFVLHDNDIGDNIATRVMADPQWGTPLFFAEPGSYTSDPWEPGTNKAVDFTMEVLEQPDSTTFDYREGAHYKLKLTYTGQRELDNSYTLDFQMYDLLTDLDADDNPAPKDNPTVRFNGDMALYCVKLAKQTPAATIYVSIYPPEMDLDNSTEKQYTVKIIAEETEDPNINRSVTLTPTFADLRAPRATVIAPYDGERISPVFFPAEDPFEILVVSEDTDLASIQLQIRSKQPDGVWAPWSNLFGMLWEDGGTNDNVTVIDRLNRRPPRREFIFQWTEDAIKSLGVGEYALRAVATDKASTPNSDLGPPPVVFLVDDAKPSVLNSIPDYQARESERIYRGELSVTFTDDMRSTDFSDRTFYVMDLLNNNTKVAGYVSYSPALRKTVFVPIVPFRPNGFYRVEVKTDVDTDGDDIIDEQGVHDLAGNP